MAFDRWETEQYAGRKPSRVQTLIKDVTVANNEDQQPRNYLRLLGFTDEDFKISLKVLHRGIKYLVIEGRLKNYETRVGGITAFSLFAYTKWHQILYGYIPVLVLELQNFPKLLALAKNKMNWMKEVQQHYDSATPMAPEVLQPVSIRRCLVATVIGRGSVAHVAFKDVLPTTVFRKFIIPIMSILLTVWSRTLHVKITHINETQPWSRFRLKVNPLVRSLSKALVLMKPQY